MGSANPKIYMIAGEASGDQLGADLLHALHREYPARFEVMGIGGELMAREGLSSLFELHLFPRTNICRVRCARTFIKVVT